METWREIVAEMRGPVKWHSQPWQLLDEYARRIETACKTLEAENAKLRRALEPVMKYEANAWIETPAMAYAAIRAAQAIMKEGAE